VRATALGLVSLLLAAGCLDLARPPPPEPSTTTLDGAMVFQAQGDRVVPVPLPEGFGPGLRVATVPTLFRGAEPNIGVTAGGNVYVSAYESILRSRDQGRTWQEAHRMSFGAGQTYDPMLWVDVPTGRVTSTHIYPDKTCSTLVWAPDGDAESPAWNEQPLRCPSPLVDHQKVATGALVGPYAALGAAAPFPRLLTMCYNKVATQDVLPGLPGVSPPAGASGTRCAMSVDGGMSYVSDVEVDAAPGGLLAGRPAPCGGLNGHQAHGPDGTIFVPYGYACRRGRVAVSTNGGTTWTRRDLGVDQLEVDPEVAVAVDGTAYYLYRGGDQALHLLRSRDTFASFDGPFRISPPEVKGTVFAGMAAGSAGRLAFAYLGTPDTSAGPDEANDTTAWNLYVGMSLDADSAAPTIVTVQANPPGDPVQRGSICHSKPCVGEPSNRNLLDFIDATVGPDGRFWVSYADGCTAACREPGATADDSRDDTTSVAWILEGPSLLAGRPRLGGEAATEA
jgi:hypothetical protein